MDKKSFSLICAIVTSVLWGSAFVAQDMGMDFIGPHTFNVGRFLIGFLTLVPFFFIFEFKNINFKQLDKRKIAYFLFYLGFVLAIGQELQQISLIYTDVANTGVFTVFYVLVVPVISYFIFSKKMHWSIWPSVFICILGGLLLSELNNYSVRLGDTLGILSAFCWGVHILLIRKTIEMFNFPITIAMSQCFVACLVLIGPMFYFEDPTFSNFLKDWIRSFICRYFIKWPCFFITNIQFTKYISSSCCNSFLVGRCFRSNFGMVNIRPILK